MKKPKRPIHPLPWTVKVEDNETLSILDANGDCVLWGNVSRQIEYDDPSVPTVLRQALERLGVGAK